MNSEETLRIEDQTLEAFGDIYRKLCGRNHVLMTKDFKILTFEKFLKQIDAQRRPGCRTTLSN